MEIAVAGYGAMGREVVHQARLQGIGVAAVWEIADIEGATGTLAEEKDFAFDVALDFSWPGAVVDNCRLLAAQKKNIVIGATGWYDRLDEVRRIAEEYGTGIIYGSNFSIGMQMLFRITRYASKLMNRIPGYDIMIHEMHHARKQDSPSGTALTMANIILEEVEAKKAMLGETSHGRIAPEQLHVSSTRGGEITGLHTVFIDSFADTIELTHRAKNRSGLALGALEAAKWIDGKKGFFNFEEMLKNIWEE